MFVRYIDGDNVSFKELFRNIKSPIVFTSAWTCFKFIFKVIGPLCLVLGMILWTAVSMDSKIGVLEFAAFIFFRLSSLCRSCSRYYITESLLFQGGM